MTEEQRPAKIFIAYSHKDEEYRDQLVRHASQLKQNGLVEIWHDRKLLPGSEWEGEIDKKLSDADIFIPLMSSDFIASDYCSDVEMKKALEMHARHEILIIPVVVRPCDWIHGPLAVLQALPVSAKAVKSWNDPDEAWLSVVDGIRTAVGRLDEMRQNSILSPIGAKSESATEVIRMIYEDRPEAAAACRTYMQGLYRRLEELAPQLEPEDSEEKRDEESLKAIEATEQIVAEYVMVVQAIAQHNAFDAMLEIQKSFIEILKDCRNPNYPTLLESPNSDYYRFLGHELCTILYAILLDVRAWECIEKLLKDVSLVTVGTASETRMMRAIWDLPGHLILAMRGSKEPRVEGARHHAALLRERYQSESLSKVFSFDRFIAGDVFLAIAYGIGREGYCASEYGWTPWSIAYFYEYVPIFIQEMRTKIGAEKVRMAVGANSVDELRKTVQSVLGRMEYILGTIDYRRSLSRYPLSDIGKY